MITLIRKGFKSKSYRIVMWVTLAAVAGLFSLPEFFKRLSGDGTWVARVNSCTIDYKEFARRAAHYEERIQMLRDQYGPYADMLMMSLGMTQNPKAEAINSLIGDQLLDNVAQSLNIQVDDAYVAAKLHDERFIIQQLSDIIPFTVLSPTTGKIDQQKLMAYLRRSNTSVEEFEKAVEKQLRKYLVLELIAGAAYVPSFIVKDAYQNSLPKKFSILTFSLDTLVGQERKKEVSEQALKDFYEGHLKKYNVPEKRSGIRWVFSPMEFGIEIPEAEIQAYYNSHKLTKFITAPAQVQVRAIFIKGKTGDSYQRAQKVLDALAPDKSKFEALAKEFSEDAASAKTGGLLPWIKRSGEKNKPYERAAFALKEDGDISSIISDEEGLYIMQRVARKTPEYKDYSVARGDIKTQLTKQKFNENFGREVKAALEANKTDPQALEGFIKAKHGVKHDIAPTEKNADSAVAQALFRVKEHGFTQVMEGGQGVLVELLDVKKQHTPALADIRAAVLEDLFHDRAAKSLKKLLKEAKEASRSTPMEEIKKTWGGTLEATAPITKNSPAVAELGKHGVPAQILFGLERAGNTSTFEAQGKGFLIKLDAQSPFQEQAYNEEKNTLSNELFNQQASLITDGYVASLYRTATIKSNDSLLTIPEE